MIPLKTILQELSNPIKLHPFKFIAHSTVYKDNNGCSQLTMTQAMTPCAKNIGIVCHWFCSHIVNPTVHVVKVDAKLQIVDTFTKPLGIEDFE